jgi:RNA polymerase sigma-70 factor, ECF subfamily
VTTEHDGLSGQFEQHRAHLRGVAYRVLGSLSDADDAVQEAWLRVSRAETGDVANVRAWLTTVVARISLNILRSRTTRREEVIGNAELFRMARDEALDAEQEAMLADSVGLALLVVLERLTPAERLAFVLHDMFDLPFEEIAPIVGRSPVAARQLASRARRRVQGGNVASDADLRRRREVVEAFLAASRTGTFGALVTLLDPDVEFRVDEVLRRPGGRGGGRGAATLINGAPAFAHAARFCRVALLDGSPGLVMAPRGRLARAIVFTFSGDRVSHIEVIADPERLRRLHVAVVEPDAPTSETAPS